MTAIQRITVRGPFSWQQTVSAFSGFQPVSRPGTAAGDETLRFAFRLDGSLEAAAVALGPDDTGGIAVDVAGTLDVTTATAQAARILSLDWDATTYPEVGVRDPAIGRLMEALPGLRPICFLSPYECAAWGVISQRISMRQAAAVQSRLVEAHGEPVAAGDGTAWCFPHPDALLGMTSFPGLPAVKVERLHGVARAALDGRLDVRRLLHLGAEQAERDLREIPGIGPFWASAVYLRACGIRDVFPDEPVSIAALGAVHGLGTSLSASQVRELTDPYSPWRMWVCYLLRVAAGSAGLIPGIRGREMALRRDHRRAGPTRREPRSR